MKLIIIFALLISACAPHKKYLIDYTPNYPYTGGVHTPKFQLDREGHIFPVRDTIIHFNDSLLIQRGSNHRASKEMDSIPFGEWPKELSRLIGLYPDSCYPGHIKKDLGTEFTYPGRREFIFWDRNCQDSVVSIRLEDSYPDLNKDNHFNPYQDLVYRPLRDTILFPVKDTSLLPFEVGGHLVERVVVPVIMLVSDTSLHKIPIYYADSTFEISQPMVVSFTVEQKQGFEVREKHNTSEGVIDPYACINCTWTDYYKHIDYLDKDKKPLPKNYCVWLTKEYKP